MPTVALIAMLASSQASVADLSWLTGCWKMSSGARTATEHWLPPDGGTMRGVSRTVSAGRTVEYEFIVLRMGDKGVEYAANPSGEAGAVFTATRVSDEEAVFETRATIFRHASRTASTMAAFSRRLTASRTARPGGSSSGTRRPTGAK